APYLLSGLHPSGVEGLFRLLRADRSHHRLGVIAGRGHRRLGHRDRLATQAATWVRLDMSSLARMCETWTATVLREISSRRAISVLVSPSASSEATSRSRGVSGARPPVGPAATPAAPSRWVSDTSSARRQP